MERPKTILCDIDGTLLPHVGDMSNQHLANLEALPGVKEKLKEWDRKGYKIILITGRRESTRPETETQLSRAGIFYDQLIMSVTGGERILINDAKEDSKEPTAAAITVKRNGGLSEVDV